MKKKVRTEISNLDHQGLVRYKDAAGNRLHPKAIRAEIVRRVKEHVTPGHPNESTHLRRQRESRAARVLK